ncbi:hypothetical protein DSO57_1027600 [Entomophthora muscae]|uniref:Uncharacterized protein n=1 Tax=Entomophthora muscae TaxID=34485 RepID=A0ACC2ULR9_9FUNG|nr:hypothetical protein DSO57_1027600 [Entomophthora muscae]
MSGSFEAGEKLSSMSYSLDLVEELTIPPDGRLVWQKRVPGNKLPGDLQRHLDSVYYIVGGYFYDVRLRRRHVNTNALTNTSLANEPTVQTTPQFQRSSTPANLPPEKKYLDALNDDLRVGCFYNNSIYLIQPSQGIASLTVFSNNQYTIATTTGPAPSYRKGFSVAQIRNMMYLVTPGKVHSLNLNTLVWGEHAVPDLVAAKSGCLYIHKSTLIHAFGMVNNRYSDTTQFINTITWELASTYSPHTPTITANYVIILASCSSFALLVAAAMVTTFLLHRRRSNKYKLTPPQYITESVWVTPKPKYSMDVSLNTDPSQSYDFTIDTKPFISSQ